MTEQQFDERMKQIDEGYAKRRQDADAYRDQELSRLFNECGWTQEKIARRMGKKQQWVSLRLCFGRFLNFTTTGCKGPPPDVSSLTERRFRSFWSKTKGCEEERFAQVAVLASGDVPTPYRNMQTKPGFRPTVKDILADGKWHKFEAILADFEEKHPGESGETLSRALQGLKIPAAGQRVESKSKGKVFHYRLVSIPRNADPARLAAQSLYEQCKPFLEELLAMSRQHRAALAPGELAKIATKMQRLFEAACPEDTVDVQR